jgi:hypothetical protein
MPQVQQVDLTQREPEPTGVQEFFSKLGKSFKDKEDRVEIGKLLDQYKQNRNDANAWEDLQLGLESSTISPTKRLETQKSLNEMRKVITERDKTLNAKVNKGILTQEEKIRQKGNLVKAGYPEEIAEFYLDAPPGVQGVLAREHKELVERGLRKPLVKVPEGIDQEEIPAEGAVTVPDSSSPNGERAVVGIGQETSKEKLDAQSSRPIPEKEWPEIPLPTNMTHAERVKWGNSNEKDNNNDLKETIAKKHSLRESSSLINGMTKINDGKYLPSGLGKLITIDPESGDIRETANLAEVANAQTQLYIKNLKRWQRGAKEFYGSRVTNFDLQSFMQQLPTLLNSEQGRRLILKQMQYSNDLEAIYNNTLNEALKHYGRNASFNQISEIVDGKIRDKEEDLIGKIDNLVDASDYINLVADNPDRFRGMVVMQKPDGSFRAVPKEKLDNLRKKGWRDF